MVKQVHVPTIQKVQKTVKVPQIQYEDQIVEVPVQKQVNVPMIEKVPWFGWFGGTGGRQVGVDQSDMVMAGAEDGRCSAD